MSRIAIRLARVLLGICRTMYCWMFFILPPYMIHAVYTNVLRMERTHSVEKGDIVSNIAIASYAVVLGIAWWKIFRSKPASERWAIAANVTLIFIYLPGLLSGNWRGVLDAELEWWPVILVGIFGIIIFSIPYHGWRSKSQVLTTPPSATTDA